MHALRQKRLDRAVSIADLRELARRRLPRAIFDFIDGGAEDERTLADNTAAFERLRLLPRVLEDVRAPDTRADILGLPSAAPLLVAPMGSCMLGWPEADIAIARAATRLGIPYTLSTMSTTSIERMADAVQGALWFQLYVLKNRAFNDQLVDRAQAAGYQALVVTVDLPAGGKRERDLRNGVQVPILIEWRHVLAGLLHPHWSWQMLRHGLPDFENVRGYPLDGSPLDPKGTAGKARAAQELDASYNWTDLTRLRDRWRGRLLVKGVLHPEDAARLVSMGVDGIWVSNHGGRQLDGAAASADALPAIATAVGGRVPLIVDSGVRRGVDILKARALGAQAVAVGRAALWGASAAGEAGAHKALSILINELRLAMKLAGTPDLDAVARLGLSRG